MKHRKRNSLAKRKVAINILLLFIAITTMSLACYLYYRRKQKKDAVRIYDTMSSKDDCWDSTAGLWMKKSYANDKFRCVLEYQCGECSDITRWKRTTTWKRTTLAREEVRYFSMRRLRKGDAPALYKLISSHEKEYFGLEETLEMYGANIDKTKLAISKRIPLLCGVFSADKPEGPFKIIGIITLQDSKRNDDKVKNIVYTFGLPGVTGVKGGCFPAVVGIISNYFYYHGGSAEPVVFNIHKSNTRSLQVAEKLKKIYPRMKKYPVGYAGAFCYRAKLLKKDIIQFEITYQNWKQQHQW